MKQMCSLIAMLAFIQTASAACPVADRLIDTYGISFSGFEKKLPEAARPLEHGARVVDLVVIRLPNRKGAVPDGFIHSALINKEAKRAWIRRKGGFAPEEKWYGPIKLDSVNLQGCVVEAYK
jgi:hypothetical protein